MHWCLVWCFIQCFCVGAFCDHGAAVQSIDCRETAESLLQSGACNSTQNCTVYCKGSCYNDSEAEVLGTAFYALPSSICKSALHDLRISYWNTSAKTVTFVTSGQDDTRSNFVGSVRFNIQSKNHFPRTRNFYFTSPRIIEEVLDVTMLHRNFIYGCEDTPSQECHVPEKYTAHFDYTVKEMKLNGAVNLSPSPSNGYYNIVWPRTISPNIRTNMFWCRLHNRLMSDIASPAIFYGDIGPGHGCGRCPTQPVLSTARSPYECASRSSFVPFLPRHYTITVSLGEPLEIDVVPLKPGNVTSWVKEDGSGSGDQPVLYHGGQDMHKLNYKRAELHHSGVYIVSLPSVKDVTFPGENRALMRVIVRMCRANKYGPLCESTCPDCKNGGICHDITGRCICPPGFKGELCEEACGDDKFGQQCQKRCSDTNPDPKSKTCSGIMICLPDPYGCSCGTGFKGFFCNETCSRHEYGADCKKRRVCHCKNNGTCNIFTGTCFEDQGECLDGWKNKPYCDISYPLLKRKPKVSDISDTSARVMWDAWKSGRDTGEGNPKAYLLQYKEITRANWPITRNVIPPTIHSRVLSGLKPDTSYEVRVLVIDSDNKYRSEGAQEKRFRTRCGRPSETPSSIMIDTSHSRSITVKWENPPRHSWNCWTINVTLMYNDSRTTFNLTDYPGSHPKTNHSFSTKPYTLWNIKLRMETPDGEPGEWTAMGTVISAQDAPSAVLNVTLEERHTRNATIRWLPPNETNGILRNYEITFRLLPAIERTTFFWRECASAVYTNNSTTVTCDTQRITLSGLKPYAEYVVTIRAFTIKAGQEAGLTFRTARTVPDGMVWFLSPAIRRDHVEIRWSKFPCEQVNGILLQYLVTTQSPDPWETEVYEMWTWPNLLRSGHADGIVYHRLVPHTRYNVRVTVENLDGLSRRSAYMNFTTPPVEPLAPSGLVVEQQSRTNISLTWIAPYPPYGVLDYYNIELRPESTTAPAVTRHVEAKQALCSGIEDPRMQCSTIFGLQPDTKYYITVFAANNGTGLGLPSEVVEAETRVLPPDPPRGLSVRNPTEHSIRVAWKAPAKKNGVLMHYRVNSSLVHSYDAELLNTSLVNSSLLWNTSTLWYDLKPLFPGCTYNVCVEASTSAGYGAPQCKQAHTKASVPLIDEPGLQGVVDNMVILQLSPASRKNGPISNYYVLVVRGYEDLKGDVTPLPYQESLERGLHYYVAARVAPGELKEDREFLAGDDSVVGGYHNAPLEPATPYRFSLLVESNISGHVTYTYRLSQPIIVNPRPDGGTTVAVLISVLLIFAISAAALYYRSRRKRNLSAERRCALAPPATKEVLSKSSVGYDKCAPETEEYVVLNTSQRKGTNVELLSVQQFRTHVINAEANGTLKEEYMAIDSGELHPCEVAKRPENMHKNRYGNVLPYDHSRVILSELPDGGSDYINANYVAGYNNDRRYIATQGPTLATVTDFWLMVWGSSTRKIVMLTNLKDQQEIKCVKYWPESVEQYGDIEVRLHHTDTTDDFVIREFAMSRASRSIYQLKWSRTHEEKCRHLLQFHFTSWPEHGVPTCLDATCSFMTRVRGFHHGDSPIIVHCSAGTGATGTFILMDSVLDQAEDLKQLDVLSHLNAMRQCRVNLVESLDQYVFAHRALVELLCAACHSISVTGFMKLVQELRIPNSASNKSIIQEEFEELNRPIFRHNETYKSALSYENVGKNQTRDVLAGDSKRFLLCPPQSSCRTDYINAVYVDGYKSQNVFLVTQFPRPNTVEDFWQMVSTSKTTTIVTLDGLDPADKNCPQFWPEVHQTLRNYGCSVYNTATTVNSGIVMRTFRVEQNEQPSRTVRQFHLQCWPRSNPVPPSCDVILSLIEQVEDWQSRSANTVLVVQCTDGCRASGLFCASSIIWKRMKTEQMVDVFQSVQTIRRSRTEFVRDLVQYQFCYDVALAFLDNLSTYANFQ
ncbi:receptor-type tyrosine-protein phosphatase U-like [Ornithodoros turicata]|uniref:receptor-type tyrosine-protein phosphatase U-like n=1 Tax=Ornithodoros turicata TaxID=34597 RepID=UPI003138845E